MQQFQLTIFNAEEVDASINGSAIDASNLYSVSVQAIATGAMDSSTVKIQVSNDSPIGNQGFSSSVWTPTNWADLTNATVTMTAAGNYLIPKTDLCYQFIRIVYTAVGSPAGTLTVKIKGMAL